MASTEFYKDEFTWDYINAEITKKFYELLDKRLKEMDEEDQGE